jgi:hypothetical protein
VTKSFLGRSLNSVRGIKILILSCKTGLWCLNMRNEDVHETTTVNYPSISVSCLSLFCPGTGQTEHYRRRQCLLCLLLPRARAERDRVNPSIFLQQTRPQQPFPYPLSARILATRQDRSDTVRAQCLICLLALGAQAEWGGGG